ncbi:MAG TPA: SGNH/GDSL hydrolase family protein [Planctomycetota bacterium]|nr:SGNH/GDSL hydrolase family protein [Planctomycetota bacterium]
MMMQVSIPMVLMVLAFGLQDPPAVPVQECRPRGGLPNFLAKAATPGLDIKVAYFGGSITAQPGWRPKTLAYFQKSWPSARFSEINAAIGGTGSDLGVFRLSQDVLEKKPDLLFVEFAVNDGGAAPDQIRRCMEGIVRQTWKTLPDCDICFVYTLTEALAKPMIEGTFPRAAATMEEVAERYGIPSIHLAVDVARLAKEGKLIWKAPLPKTDEERKSVGDSLVFAADGVHPYPETGHELYLQAVVRSLPLIQGASKARGPHAVPAPLLASNYERARLLPISEAVLSKGFSFLDPQKDGFGKRWADRLSALHRAGAPGDVLSFKFKGTRCSIYDIIGPDCGQVVVTLDDQAPRTVPRFDSFCTYHRLATLLIGTELPDTVHSVRIEIHPDAPDKVKILAQRHETMDKPDRYQGTAFYPGAILLVGELTK